MIEVLPRWSAPAPAPPEAAPQHELEWRAPRTARPPRATAKPPTLGDFSATLARAGILDNGVVDLPGAVVALPYGVELLERFRARVHAIYRDNGLGEHEYPLLAPVAALAPVRELLDLDGRLLLAGSSGELAAGAPALALLPSGEAAIYGGWARRVRARGDLPIRMYRRARYFRPVSRGRHGGRGVFYALEHDDVFEFHCAYASQEQLRTELRRYWAMLSEVVRALHVPALWSTRPPWTNRHEVADWAIAADVPLPTRATTQIAALYNQGTRFSRPFGVGYREHGELHHAEQLAGYVSRRLLLVHLLLGMTPAGDLFLHPELAPAQVVVLLRATGERDAAAARALVERLRDAGIRARLELLERPAQMRTALERWSVRGTPLVLLAFPPRIDGEPFKLVLRRGDSGEEAVLPSGERELAERCAALLDEIGASWRRRTAGFAAGRVAEVHDLGGVREALADRRVAVCPLAAGESVVHAVAAWRAGEVLGFCGAAAPRPCVITGEPVDTVGLISPRV